jgi:FMN phosphatase YigB (HAD superfamily)
VDLRAIFFDVGETLVDEQGYWREIAERAGLRPHVVWAALGATIERGEEHGAIWDRLGVKPPETADIVAYTRADLYPDALDCLERCRAAGLLVGIAGNQSAATEEWVRREGIPADVVGTSESWGVAKPSADFFARIAAEAACPAGQVAYVGDRVDNDVVPARAAGLIAVHVRRGPWGHLQPGAEQAHVTLDSLELLPDVLL